MSGEIYCKDCRHKCKEDLNDREIEKLWNELEDVPVDENKCLDIDWKGWNKGTHREEILHWFDIAKIAKFLLLTKE